MSQKDISQQNYDQEKQSNINKMLEMLRLPNLSYHNIQQNMDTIEQLLLMHFKLIQKMSNLDQNSCCLQRDNMKLSELLQEKEKEKQKLEREVNNERIRFNLWDQKHQKELKEEREVKENIKKQLIQMISKDKGWQFEFRKKDKQNLELRDQLNKIRKHQESKAHEYYKVSLVEIQQIDNNEAQKNIGTDLLEEFIHKNNMNYDKLANENMALRECFIKIFEKMQQNLLSVEKGIQELQKYLKDNGISSIVEQVKFIEVRSNIYGLCQEDWFDKAIEVMSFNFERLADKNGSYRSLVKQAVEVQKQKQTKTPIHSNHKVTNRNSVQSQFDQQEQQQSVIRLDSLQNKMYKLQLQIQMQNEFMNQLLEIEPKYQVQVEEYDRILRQLLEDKSIERQTWRDSICRVEVEDNRRIIKEGQVVESQLRELKIQQQEISRQQ